MEELPDLRKLALAYSKKYFGKEQVELFETIHYRWNRRFQGMTAGRCSFKKESGEKYIPYSIEISLKYYMNFPEMLESILLHEMIHAVLPAEEKHGPLFQKEAKRINTLLAKNKKTEQITAHIAPEKMMPRAYRYCYICSHCHQIYQRVRKPIDVKRSVCGRCKGKLMEFATFKKGKGI